MIHIIDDEATLRELLECFAEDAGYESLSFESGDQYLQFLTSPEFAQPVVILSDVTMPGISGYDLVLEVHKKHPTQKIILITGFPNEQDNPEAASQICYTLKKPYQPDKLMALLAHITNCEKISKNNPQRIHTKKCECNLNQTAHFISPITPNFTNNSGCFPCYSKQPNSKSKMRVTASLLLSLLTQKLVVWGVWVAFINESASPE